MRAAGAALLILGGVWVLCQVTRGAALRRLKVAGEPTVPGEFA